MRRATQKTFNLTEALNGAYSLSYQILAGDMKSALDVTQESLNEWKVEWNAQNHRTYHKALPNRTPNKMLFSRPVLLQHTVCEKTTPYEIAHETAFLNGQGSLTEETLLLRFIKHTVHESSHRSFNLAIGNCRILHKYDHATTKDFYGVLDQRNQERLVEGEPDNFTDDKYRNCKMILINSLGERFEEFVTVVHGPRNEKRFLPNDQPSAWSQYAGECLGLLTPWKTEHILPEEFEPTQFNIPKLKCHGRDEWDSVEENRMHTIIDPACFSRLAKACGAPAPEQQVDIPQFKNVELGSAGGSDGRIAAAPELTGPQVSSIRDELDRRATRRRVAVSEHLSVEVDGVERGRLDTANNTGVRIDLSPESRQIQVFTTDAEGKLLLASLWLSLIDITPDTGWQSSMVLEGGQRLGIDIKPVRLRGELESLVALVSYEECYPLRILTHHFQQIRGVISEQFQLATALSHARLLQGAIYNHRIEFAMLMLFVAVATLYLIVPRHNSPLAAHTGAHVERTAKLVQSESAPPPTIPKRFNPAVHENQITGPPPAGSQDREQVLRLRPRSEGLAFTGGYPMGPRERTLKMSVSDPLTQQRIFNYRSVLFEPYGSSEWVGSIAEGLGERQFFTNDKRLVFAMHNHVGDGILSANWTRLSSTIFALFDILTDARGAVGVGSNDQSFWTSPFTSTEGKLAGIRLFDRDFDRSHWEGRLIASESFSPGTLNWERCLYTLLTSSDQPNDAAQASLCNRSRITGNTPKELGRRDLSRRRQAVDNRSKAFNQILEMAHAAYEEADVRSVQLNVDVFNLFNNYNRQLSKCRSLGETTAPIEISGGDMSRVKKFHAANCVEQKQITFDSGNHASVSNTSPLRFGVKFQF